MPFLEKRTGIPRTIHAIRIRRNHLDAAWGTDPVGYVALGDIAGLGSRGYSSNERAKRKATEDGVLKSRFLGGKIRFIVPIAWADEWLAEREAERLQADELIAAGWLTTAQVAKLMNITRRRATIILTQFSKRGGYYGMFQHVRHHRLWDGRSVWEPTEIRAAIVLYNSKRARPKPQGWWGLKRTADELQVAPRSIRDATVWLRKLGFEEVESRKNGFGRKFWNPQQVRAFREAHGEAIDEQRRTYGMKYGKKRSETHDG